MSKQISRITLRLPRCIIQARFNIYGNTKEEEKNRPPMEKILSQREAFVAISERNRMMGQSHVMALCMAG